MNTYQTVEGDSGNATSSHSKQDKSLMARQWSDIDNKFLKPLLTHCNPTLLDTMPTRCLPLGRIFTSNAQLANHPLMNRDESTDTDLSALEKVAQNLVGKISFFIKDMENYLKSGHIT